MDAMRIEQDALAAERVVIMGGTQGWQPPPEHRRCRHTMEDGERCRRWVNVGDTMCYRHFRYAGTDPLSPIKVPLLEDSASILMTVTQTVRALALGTIPQGNARAMLYGCNIAERVLKADFERAKFLRALRKEEAAEEAAAVAAGAAEPGAAGTTDPAPAAAAASDASMGETEWVPEPEVETALRGMRPRFPDVKKNWDESLARAEGEITKHFSPAEGESGAEWVARNGKPVVPAHARGVDAVRAERAEWNGTEDVTAFGGVPKFETNGWSEQQIEAWYYAHSGTTGPEARAEAQRVARLIVEDREKKRAEREDCARRSAVSAQEGVEGVGETLVLSRV